MAGTPKKASQFIIATSINDNAIIPFVYNGDNYYITGANLKIAVAGNLFTNGNLTIQDGDSDTIQISLGSLGRGSWSLQYWAYSSSRGTVQQTIDFFYDGTNPTVANRGNIIAYPSSELETNDPGGITITFSETVDDIIITITTDGTNPTTFYFNYSIKPIGNG
jgi:hypothetical protein